MSDREYDAIIVGAGHNGLVCAGYLARAGLRVLVLERRPIVGGACATEELFPGYKFNTCAQGTRHVQPKIIHDLQLRKNGVGDVYLPDPSLFRPFPDGRHLFFWQDEARTDPSLFRPFPDGRHLFFWQDEARTVEEIRRYSRHDAAAYPAWVALQERILTIFEPYVMQEPPTLSEVFAKLRGTYDELLLEKILTTGRADMLDEFFELDILKACLVSSGDAGDPRAVGSAIPYVSYALVHIPDEYRDEYFAGIPRGGVGVITRAMANAAEGFGAEIRTNAEVRQILVAGGEARGVVLADGTRIGGRLVVSNADPKRTFLKLVGEQHLDAGFAAQIRRLRSNVAYLKFHAAVSELPDFSHYLGPSYEPRLGCRFYINPSVEAYEQAWRDAVNGIPSRRPVLSVQIMSIYDDTLAPPGQHVVSMFGMYAPVTPAHGTWDDLREAVGENFINIVTEYAPNFRRSITHWLAETPFDLERRVGLTGGNIHHVDVIPSQMLARRPLPGWSHYQTPVPRLWLCGAGTHPGGEVCGAPGHNAAQAILKQWKG
jgi:phytoene dehydrogenase-like protein